MRQNPKNQKHHSPAGEWQRLFAGLVPRGSPIPILIGIGNPSTSEHRSPLNGIKLPVTRKVLLESGRFCDFL